MIVPPCIKWFAIGACSLIASASASCSHLLAEGNTTINGETLLPLGLVIAGFVAIGTGAWRMSAYFGRISEDARKARERAELSDRKAERALRHLGIYDENDDDPPATRRKR